MDKYEKLNETFDVTPVEIEKVKPNDLDAKLAKFENSNEDIRKDYEYTRGNLYSIIEKGQEARICDHFWTRCRRDSILGEW